MEEMKSLSSNPNSIVVDKKMPKAYQSADSFFHFVNKFKYLKEILCEKKFYPRYCRESLKPFEIDIDEIMIAMKCFCDIPLHQVSIHRKEYGDLCIGMTKEWGIKNGLQPLIYFNDRSEFPKSIKNRLNMQ